MISEYIYNRPKPTKLISWNKASEIESSRFWFFKEGKFFTAHRNTNQEIKNVRIARLSCSIDKKYQPVFFIGSSGMDYINAYLF